MTGKRTRLLTAREAAKYLRVSDHVLQAGEKSGELRAYRTPGGHRRYSVRMLNKFLQNSRR